VPLESCLSVCVCLGGVVEDGAPAFVHVCLSAVLSTLHITYTLFGYPYHMLCPAEYEEFEKGLTRMNIGLSRPQVRGVDLSALLLKLIIPLKLCADVRTYELYRHG
jgi:hypothetical protein